MGEDETRDRSRSVHLLLEVDRVLSDSLGSTDVTDVITYEDGTRSYCLFGRTDDIRRSNGQQHNIWRTEAGHEVVSKQGNSMWFPRGLPQDDGTNDDGYTSDR